MQCGLEHGATAPATMWIPPPMPGTLTGMVAAADTTAIGDTHPLIAIWLQPRATIRYIVGTNPERHLWALLMVGAFFATLDRASGRNFGDVMPVWAIFAVALVLAPTAVPLSWIGAVVGEWAGGKLGGVATREQVRAAIAWAGVPGIAVSLVLWPLQMMFYGEEMFMADAPRMAASNPFLLFGIALAGLTSAVWSMVVGVKAFAEVHQFSAWRAIGSWLLVVMLVLVPLLALILIAIVIGQANA